MTAARKPPMTPDLVSQGSAREPYSRSENQPSSSLAVAKAVNNLSLPRHVLPRDLSKAVQRLDNRELDRLLSAVLDEQRRRRRDIPVPDISLGKRRTEVASIQLTRGQINAVRAAFKAGVSPSRIARQFGFLNLTSVRYWRKVTVHIEFEQAKPIALTPAVAVASTAIFKSDCVVFGTGVAHARIDQDFHLFGRDHGAEPIPVDFVFWR